MPDRLRPPPEMPESSYLVPSAHRRSACPASPSPPHTVPRKCSAVLSFRVAASAPIVARLPGPAAGPFYRRPLANESGTGRCAIASRRSPASQRARPQRTRGRTFPGRNAPAAPSAADAVRSVVAACCLVPGSVRGPEAGTAAHRAPGRQWLPNWRHDATLNRSPQPNLQLHPATPNWLPNQTRAAWPVPPGMPQARASQSGGMPPFFLAQLPGFFLALSFFSSRLLPAILALSPRTERPRRTASTFVWRTRKRR